MDLKFFFTSSKVYAKKLDLVLPRQAKNMYIGMKVNLLFLHGRMDKKGTDEIEKFENCKKRSSKKKSSLYSFLWCSTGSNRRFSRVAAPSFPYTKKTRHSRDRLHKKNRMKTHPFCLGDSFRILP